jgi:PAS domain S-box-containing protein
MADVSTVGVNEIVDSLREGIYVCDLERRITFWSRSAERITGWPATEVVGRQCFDSVLCHVDKDGHQLCGKEYCPLHRAMVTGEGTPQALLVYARGRDGGRIPMHVSTAPLRDATGRVVGGVETFRDASGEVHDLERAKAIQRLAMQQDLPEDHRIGITTHYVPHDIIGGHYLAVRKLDEDRYGVLLADVVGHGIAAALYTMHLSQLWEHHHGGVVEPSVFTATLNNELVNLIRSTSSFATAVCGVIDLGRGVFRFAGAGGPPVLLMHAGGSYEQLMNPGLPLALMADADYEETQTPIGEGDRLLLFSDGAVEVLDADGAQLGVEGLVGLLRAQGYPEADIRMEPLEEGMLRFSNSIRLPDDLTLIDVRIRSTGAS